MSAIDDDLSDLEARRRCPAFESRSELAALRKRNEILSASLKTACEELYGDECDPKCDSYGHTETCRLVSAVEQAKAMRAENEAMRKALGKTKESEQ